MHVEAKIVPKTIQRHTICLLYILASVNLPLFTQETKRKTSHHNQHLEIKFTYLACIHLLGQAQRMEFHILAKSPLFLKQYNLPYNWFARHPRGITTILVVLIVNFII